MKRMTILMSMSLLLLGLLPGGAMADEGASRTAGSC